VKSGGRRLEAGGRKQEAGITIGLLVLKTARLDESLTTIYDSPFTIYLL